MNLIAGLAIIPRTKTAARSITACKRFRTMAHDLAAAKDFLTFLDASPTPYHAVHNAKSRLENAGYKQIKERDSWASVVKPGGKYYLTRNGSSLVAFAVGQKWRPGNPVAMIGTHTDSCCLRIKPISKKQADGYLQVGVETYGGGLWHTWFDRDLSIAGRLMVRDDRGVVVPKLVKIDKPVLRIPTLAIHLDRQETFSFNKETQLFPIAGLAAAELDRQAGLKDSSPVSEKPTGSFAPLKALTERHHPYILEIVAKQAGVTPESIQDFELVLYDTQKATIGGLNDELIFSARLDNLGMTFCALEGLVASTADKDALSKDTTIRMISMFDHEEIGSQSAQGADSPLLPAVVRRLAVLPPEVMETTSDDSYENLHDDASTAFEQTLATSFLVSADMAHSVHPNYGAKHEADHRPEMNKGTVVKINANQRYATNSPGVVLIQECAKRARTSHFSGRAADQTEGVPLQLLVVRNDSPCGSTIGPISAGKLGVRTLDLGNAQLSMHSIRETGGSHDVQIGINLFESFLTHFGELEKSIVVD